MVIHFRNILIGWFRFLFKRPTKLAKDRMAICKKCEYNEDGWCGLCGCYLKAKVRVENEICHSNKWPNVNDYGNRSNNEQKN